MIFRDDTPKETESKFYKYVQEWLFPLLLFLFLYVYGNS